jgi:cytochrome c
MLGSLPGLDHDFREETRRSEMRSFPRKGFAYGLAAAALLALCTPALAEGDAAKGKAAFAKCGICHNFATNGVGPELKGIVGRKAASVADYAYSSGMKKLGDEGFTWTEEHIDKWIADPKAMLPDSPMAQLFPGVPDAQERADIIAYLKTQ